MQLRLALNTALIVLIIIFSGQTALKFVTPSFARNSEQISLVKNYIIAEKPKLNRMRYNRLKFKDKDSDLYLTLLNEIVFQSDKKSNRSVNRSRGVSAIDLDQLLVESDADLEDMQLEREFFEMLSRHEAEIVALEIFANGSTKDADFDLLDDLRKIEKILFEKVDESQFEASLARSEDNLSQLASQEEFLSVTGNTGNTNSGTNSYENSINGLINDPSLALSIGLSQEQPLIFENGVCQIDETLRDSLREYNQKIARAEEEVSIYEEENPSPDSDTAGTSLSGAKSGRLPLGNISQSKRECPDGAMFCVTTEEIWKTRSANQLTSTHDCIDCLIREIQVESEELMSQSVAAHDLPGEPFQPNFNLKSFIKNDLKLEFNLIKKPVVFPDQAGLLTESNASELARQSSEASNPITESDNDAVENALSTTNSDTSNGLNSYGDEAAAVADQEEHQARIRSQLATVEATIEANELLANGLHSRMGASLTYYQSLQDTINEILLSMNQVNGKSSCSL